MSALVLRRPEGLTVLVWQIANMPEQLGPAATPAIVKYEFFIVTC